MLRGNSCIINFAKIKLIMKCFMGLAGYLQKLLEY